MANLFALFSLVHPCPAVVQRKGLCFSYFLAWCVIWPFSYEDMYLFLTWWAWYIGALCEYMYLRTWGGWAIEHSRSLADAEMYVCWEGNTGCVRIAFLCHFTIFTYRDKFKSGYCMYGQRYEKVPTRYLHRRSCTHPGACRTWRRYTAVGKRGDFRSEIMRMSRLSGRHGFLPVVPSSTSLSGTVVRTATTLTGVFFCQISTLEFGGVRGRLSQFS